MSDAIYLYQRFTCRIITQKVIAINEAHGFQVPELFQEVYDRIKSDIVSGIDLRKYQSRNLKTLNYDDDNAITLGDSAFSFKCQCWIGRICISNRWFAIYSFYQFNCTYTWYRMTIWCWVFIRSFRSWRPALVLDAYCFSCSFIVTANVPTFILRYSIAFFEFQTNLSVFRRWRQPRKIVAGAMMSSWLRIRYFRVVLM